MVPYSVLHPPSKILEDRRLYNIKCLRDVHMPAMSTPSTSSNSSQPASAGRRRPRSPVCLWGDPSGYAVRTSAKPEQLPTKKKIITPSPSEPSSPKLKSFSISSLKNRLSRIGSNNNDGRVPAVRRSKSGFVSRKQSHASFCWSTADFPLKLSRSSSTQGPRSNSLSERPPSRSGEDKSTKSPPPTPTTLRRLSQSSDISAIEFSINTPSGSILQKRTLVVAEEPKIVETPRRFFVSQDRTQGWRGEWNQDHMQDVISKLRQLK